MSLAFWPSGITNLPINIFLNYRSLFDILGVSPSVESLHLLQPQKRQQVHRMCRQKHQAIHKMYVVFLWTPKPYHRILMFLAFWYHNISTAHQMCSKMFSFFNHVGCFSCSATIFAAIYKYVTAECCMSIVKKSRA
jgi:hypothetical protein